MKKKKILLISNMYPSKKEKHYGVFVKNIEELLKENNYIVSKVIMYKHHNKFIKLFSYILFHLKVIIKGLFGNYDYLYVHFVSHSSLGAVIVKKIKKNVQLILNCHGNDVIKDLDEEIGNINRSHKYMKYADKVIVPSRYFKSEVMKEYNISEDKIFIYPSGGVNTNIFINKDKNDCKKRLGLDIDINYIGYVSRIETHKGWDIFLKSINEIKKSNMLNNTKFLIVGNGIEYDKMLKMIDEFNLTSYVETRNLVSQKELIDIYNSLDILVLSSYRKESLGLVGLEAMSTETFVITSNDYGPTDYIVDGSNGFTFKLKDYKDLARKIINYYNLSDKEKELILKEARKTSLEYDMNKTKDKILEVFK